MKTIEEERKYRREYMCKYRLRPDVKKKIQKYHKKYYNSTDYKKRIKEYHNSEGYQHLREREDDKRERDKCMVKLSVLSNKIQYEKRIQKRKKTPLRAKKIESLQQRLSELVLQIEKHNESFENKRRYKMRDNK